jgi:hypothetical protein
VSGLIAYEPPIFDGGRGGRDCPSFPALTALACPPGKGFSLLAHFSSDSFAPWSTW